MTGNTVVGDVAPPTGERIGYTPSEVAKAVGLTAETIRLRIATKHIAALKLGGRFIVPAAEVRRLFGAVPAVMAM